MNEAKSTRLIDYLEHIVLAIERIRDYVEDMNEVAFLMDRRTQDAVIRNGAVWRCFNPGCWRVSTI